VFKLIFILIFSSTLFAKNEFIFGYRAFFQNGIISDEKFNISKAMLDQNRYSTQICSIKFKEIKNTPTLELLIKNREKLLECFLNQKIHSRYFLDSINLSSQTTTILSIAPTKFKVERADGVLDIFLE